MSAIKNSILGRKTICIFTAILFLLPPVFFDFFSSLGAGYEQVSGLIDIRTTFSDGAHTIDQLAQMARERKFGVIVVTDHDRMALSYGLPPFRNILNITKELNSINLQGADHYLQAIQAAQSKYPDLIIIPGSETASFYYWTGNPVSGALTAHNHEKRLLTIGMVRPEDYQNMPILHNKGPFALERLKGPPFFFIGAAAFSSLLLFWRGRLRNTGFVCLTLSVLLFINSSPLKTSPFDAYSGDQGIAPYQLVIDYVNNRGGMTFWNYPETRSGVRKLDGVQVSTKPYPGVIQESKGYTGFSAVYGEKAIMTEPGNLWDITLAEYCRGYRMRPPWAIATADYHGEGQDGAKLGNYPTVFLVQEKTKEAILKAMQNGKMYACQANYPNLPRLDEFSVSSSDGHIKSISGDDIAIKGHPTIRIAISTSSTAQNGPVDVRLIRSGSVISSFRGNLPLVLEHEDSHHQNGEKIYYRMDMRGAAGMIVSNPIFVTITM